MVNRQNSLTKKEIRDRVLHLRKSLEENDYGEYCSIIQRSVIKSPEFQASRYVAMYSPIKMEVSVWGIFDEVISSGRTALFPRVVGKGIPLSFHPISNREDLMAGYLGILEPDGSSSPFTIPEIDLFLVPGLTFDRRGARIGYGGGFYDMTLNERGPHSTTMAVAFGFQVYDRVPTTKEDVFMDIIITEKEELRISPLRHPA